MATLEKPLKEKMSRQLYKVPSLKKIDMEHELDLLEELELLRAGKSPVQLDVNTIPDEMVDRLKRLGVIKPAPSELDLEKRLAKLYPNETERAVNSALIEVNNNVDISFNKLASDISSIKELSVDTKKDILESFKNVQQSINQVNFQLELQNKRLLIDRAEDKAEADRKHQELIRLIQGSQIVVPTQELTTVSSQVKDLVKAGVAQSIKQLLFFPFNVLNIVLFAPAGRGFKRVLSPFLFIWDIIAMFIVLLMFATIAIQLNKNYPTIYIAIINSLQIVLDASKEVLGYTYSYVEEHIPDTLDVVKYGFRRGANFTTEIFFYLLAEFKNFLISLIPVPSLPSLPKFRLWDGYGYKKPKRKSVKKRRKSKSKQKSISKNKKRIKTKSKRKKPIKSPKRRK